MLTMCAYTFIFYTFKLRLLDGQIVFGHLIFAYIMIMMMNRFDTITPKHMAVWISRPNRITII